MKRLFPVLFALGLLVSGCGRSPEESPSVAVDRPITLDSLDLALSYSNTRMSHPRPEALRTYLQLLPTGEGILCVVGEPGWSTLNPIGWRLDGEATVIKEGQAYVNPSGTLRWTEFRLNLSDENGDGEADRVAGTAKGSWENIVGDAVDTSDWEAVIQYTQDTTGTKAAFYPARRFDEDPLLVTHGIRIGFSKPVQKWELKKHCTILAGGEPLQGTLQDENEVLDLVTGATFVPAGMLPFEANLELDLEGLADPSGRTVAWNRESLHTLSDPGSLTRNGGFEKGLDNWTGEGSVRAGGQYQGLAPMAGRSSAVVMSDGMLVGYFEVPANARRLTFQAAVFSEAGQFDKGRSACVDLTCEGNTAAVFDAADYVDRCKPCDGDGYGQLIEPVTVEVDLEPYRGKRVILTAHAEASGMPGVNHFALILDDFRVR